MQLHLVHTELTDHHATLYPDAIKPSTVQLSTLTFRKGKSLIE